MSTNFTNLKERFVQKANNKYKGQYDYSQSNYKGTRVPMSITCTYHNYTFEQMPEVHLKSALGGCSICNKEFRKKLKSIELKYDYEYETKFNKIHNNRYKYVFTNTKVLVSDKITIVCKIHGNFQQSIANHLKGHNCKQCSDQQNAINKINLTTAKQYIKKAKALKLNIDYSFVLDTYTKLSGKIKLKCNECAYVWNTQANTHLLKQTGCPKCQHKVSKEAFIKKSKSIYKDRYDYSLVPDLINNNRTHYLEIKCIEHDVIFKQNTRTHLEGWKGCKFCSEKLGWTKTNFMNKYKDKDTILYLIKIYNDTEEFYKIGITGTSIKLRFKNLKHSGYKYEIIKSLTSSANIIWDTEYKLKRYILTNALSYKALIKFGGSATECFQCESIPNEIINEFNK